MPKIVELRPDRSFIRKSFDGYRLSLDPVAKRCQDVKNFPVHKALIGGDQYTILHTHLFCKQNLLHVDPWIRTCNFFISVQGEVVRSYYNESTGLPDGLQVVFRIAGGLNSHKKGDYNYSLHFISEKYCVICDGINKLLLLDTGDRLKGREWKQIANTIINSSDTEIEERNYMLYDCRLDTIQEEKQISLILGRVHRVDGDDNSSTHYNHLHWSKWILKGSSWVFTILDTLESTGLVYYCGFEPRAESVVICSNRDFQFRSQKNTIKDELKKEDPKPQLHSGLENFNYTWSQSEDDIYIKFDELEGKNKTDFDVTSTQDKITVKCIDKILFDRTLFEKIDPDSTTWTFENDALQVSLTKQEEPYFWPCLLANGNGPLENITSVRVDPFDNMAIPNLEAPLEECDFPMGAVEDDIKIVRLNFPSKSVTHSVLLGSNPPLFATNLRAGFPRAIVTRQDVDASLWLQQYNPSKPEEWTVRHEGNLYAFGYIQASKQQKKFIDCAPDLNYAIICESYHHVFLYKSNYDTANGLRNRSGPQVTIGKQHLISLEDVGEVLGLTTATNVVTLLTEKCILYLQVN